MSEMSEIDENYQKWTKKVMEGILEVLGADKNEAHYEFVTSTDIYVSTMRYITLKFKSKTTGNKEELAMVLKKPMHNEFLRQMLKIDNQFYNEILFYETYARRNDNVPRYFYGNESPPFDSVIALENLSGLGYSPCPLVCNASIEYTVAAMRQIGRFHGKGYVMKQLQRDEFFGIVERIRETRYDVRRQKGDFGCYVDITAPRAVQYLRRQGYDPVFCDQAEALLSNCFDRVMMKTVQPQEPLATLSHGDFTLGNVLFKAEGRGNYRGMLIDFAQIRYATPVIDLSTYICLSCSNDVIKESLPEIIRAYHDALKEYLQDAGIWDAEKYSYDAIMDNYVQGSLFGYVIASFYLVHLMGYYVPDVDKMTNADAIIEQAKLFKEAGGDEMSKILADMLLHMRDLGCFKYLI